MKNYLNILFFILCSITLYSQPTMYFDSANEQGIDHSYLGGAAGGGVSFCDFNNDGLDDITLATGEEAPIQFYVNSESGFQLLNLLPNEIQKHKSVVWVDIDNDGTKELYVTAFDGVNKLFKDIGSLQFENISADYGLPVDTFRSYGAVWGDYDRDGYIDLYYAQRPSNSSSTIQNRMFRNIGGTSFEDVTFSSGADDEGRLPFCAAFFDFNDDKWPDLYIANDKKKRNTLLRNEGGTYTDVSEECNAGIEMDAMNVAVADIDNNGLQDIYVTNIPDGNVLLKCNKVDQDYAYEEEAEERGIGFYGVGWGANFLDIDNDGWQDIYVSGMLVGADRIASALYVNDQTGNFTAHIPAFEADTVTSFTNAIGDWNNDGYPDIMSNNADGFKSQLWTAEPGDNNWLKIRLNGVLSNKDGIGSKVEVYINGTYQNFYTHCGEAYMGQNSDDLLIGTRQATNIDSIIITWPTGHVDFLYDIEVNQKITVTEGESSGGNIDVDDDVVLTIVKTNNSAFSKINIYPNPTTGLIEIKSESQIPTYLIYDVSGNLILSGSSKKADISRLSTGTYIVIVRDGQKTKYSKIVKI